MKSSSEPHPVRYILYSHYGYHDEEDFKAYLAGEPLPDLQGVRFLLDHARGLKELLTSPGHEGLLVLFYAPGYERFLEGLAQGESLDRLLLDDHDLPPAAEDLGHKRLLFAQRVARHVEIHLKKEHLADRVRFLTPVDLAVILGRVNAIFRGQFLLFFVGPARGIRFDAPKVVEAILRLRLLGNGVPVLRLDHDVIFRGRNQSIGDLGLFKAVTIAVRAYQLRMAQPALSTFLFSASYNFRALLNPTAEMDSFEAWSRAFATRIYPALLADPAKICSICSLATDQQGRAWDEYVKTYLDDALARRFYGLKLKPRLAGLEPDGTEGLTAIGAHPLYAVISGALLCLSDGAILDLPPFSNLRMNVMWIDDHLKYSLHRAMHHLTAGEPLYLEPGLSNARLDDVTVTKARPAVSNLPCYVFDVYLPTLLWGAIMDAWITKDPILKCRVETLTAPEQAHWRKAKENQHDAPLPRAMLEVFRIGYFDPASRTTLRSELTRSAIQRIEKVRQLWAGLKTETHDTFASYWARGEVGRVFGAGLFMHCQGTLWMGVAPGRTLGEPISQLEDLGAGLALKVTELIDDTLSYVDWALEWPKFVQIVRSIRQGDFIGDLNWQPGSRSTRGRGRT